MKTKTARQQAFKDMIDCNIDISVFQYEKVLIELNNIKNETHIKIDFRCFNGGHHPKKTETITFSPLSSESEGFLSQQLILTLKLNKQ